MSYVINIEIGGFQFQFGEMGFQTRGIGTFINFEDLTIKKAIETKNPLFYEAINKLFNQSEELDAIYVMSNFEYYYLQGHPWHSLMNIYSFKSLEEFKRKALIALKSDDAESFAKDAATKILEVLNGEYKVPPPREKTPEEKARAAFERKRDKLKLKITIDRGYKCDPCGQNKENSLCLVRKDATIHDYELNNLVLRCRSCVNKLKNK